MFQVEFSTGEYVFCKSIYINEEFITIDTKRGMLQCRREPITIKTLKS